MILPVTDRYSSLKKILKHWHVMDYILPIHASWYLRIQSSDKISYRKNCLWFTPPSFIRPGISSNDHHHQMITCNPRSALIATLRVADTKLSTLAEIRQNTFSCDMRKWNTAISINTEFVFRIYMHYSANMMHGLGQNWIARSANSLLIRMEYTWYRLSPVEPKQIHVACNDLAPKILF